MGTNRNHFQARSFSTEAIVLKRFNYGEADRILTLFTPDHGKISVIAKGVRKPISRKRGHIELFNHLNAHIVHGRNLHIITEAATINHFQSWRSDLTKVGHAYHLSELVDRFLPDDQPHPEVFTLLTNSLASLSLPQFDWSNLDGYFKNRLIRILGFWPSDQTVPANLDLFINSLLDRPLKTSSFMDQSSTIF